jgi:hypothetical protein
MDGLILEQAPVAAVTNRDNNRYNGESKDGIRHGVGTYSYPMGGQEMFMYDGNWDMGVKKGQGVSTVDSILD